MMADCDKCTELIHCHGTLVLHADGGSECTEPDCSADAFAHEFVLLCSDVGGCACAGVAAAHGVGELVRGA